MAERQPSASRSPAVEAEPHPTGRPEIPVSAAAATVLSLQRRAGNAAVAAALRPPPGPRTGRGVTVVQRKPGDVSRADYDLMAQVRTFLTATTERRMGELFIPLKESFRDPSVFKSPDLRKLAISFKTSKPESLASDKAAKRGIFATAAQMATVVVDEFERDRKAEAETLEGAGGGHSLDRHGPEITDVALQLRLTTGIAPDNQISVAPGYSSKFLNYTTWLDTRQKAIDKLAAAVASTQARLIALEPRLPAAKLRETTADQAVVAGGAAKQQKHIAHARAKGQKGEGSVEELAAKSELDEASAKLTKAERGQGDVAAAVDGMLDKLELPVDRAAVDLGNIASFRVKKAYRVIVDNGAAIGTGWQGTGVQPAQQIVHGGRTVDDAVLYAGTVVTDPLTKSLTTLDGGAAMGTPLLTPVPGGPSVPNPALAVAGWGVVQHFPAPPDAVAGIE